MQASLALYSFPPPSCILVATNTDNDITSLPYMLPHIIGDKSYVQHLKLSLEHFHDYDRGVAKGSRAISKYPINQNLTRYHELEYVSEIS